MSAGDAVCASQCEMGAVHHNPSEEITLNTVFRAIGGLESSVKSLEGRQQTVERQLENVVAVANSPKECIQTKRIDDLEDGVDELEKTTNQAIGGKAMLVFIIMLFVAILGTSMGVWLSYKTSQKVHAIEAKVNGGDHE